MHTMHYFERNLYHDSCSKAASETAKSVRCLYPKYCYYLINHVKATE
jgi:hypothetical protein